MAKIKFKPGKPKRGGSYLCKCTDNSQTGGFWYVVLYFNTGSRDDWADPKDGYYDYPCEVLGWASIKEKKV